MPITEEDKRRIQLCKEVTTTFILNKEDDVAFGGNKYLVRVECDMDTGRIYYIDNITKNDVAFDNNSCLNLILLDTFDNGNYYDMNNPILLSFLENYSKSKCKLDVGISNEAIKQLNIDTRYIFTQIIYVPKWLKITFIL